VLAHSTGSADNLGAVPSIARILSEILPAGRDYNHCFISVSVFVNFSVYHLYPVL
jgi:hypothetical protein